MSSNASLKSGLCCSEAATRVGGPSPFSEIIALEFYDGPVSGVLRCSICGSVLQYKLLAWDGRQEKRVFALAKMPAKAWDQIVALYPHDRPRFPVWAPKWIELRKGDVNKRQGELKKLLALREEWSWIVLMSRYLDRFIDFKAASDLIPRIEEQVVFGEPKWQWLELFGLVE